MKNRLTERMSSDTAESLTISQIVWIVFTIVVVLAITQKLYPVLSGKGQGITNCIDKSNTLFSGVTTNTCTKGPATVAPK